MLRDHIELLVEEIQKQTFDLKKPTAPGRTHAWLRISM